MTPGRLSLRREFTPVPSHGSTFFYMIPPQNACASHPDVSSPRLSHRGENFTPYEISQRYHVITKRPPVPVGNRSAGRLERVAHA